MVDVEPLIGGAPLGCDSRPVNVLRAVIVREGDGGRECLT